MELVTKSSMIRKLANNGWISRACLYVSTGSGDDLDGGLQWSLFWLPDDTASWVRGGIGVAAGGFWGLMVLLTRQHEPLQA